ncbi:probable plastidic glucose transporter 1 isoform X2 [Cryptomeria japonica]|uniref:probable plastidic glucose transporter 1 isoform X2 n=1 Tax=Cryptomeria japonica TaxID=3369 RepID=UPI0027DA36BE|nr:probable plastidic glucose transporter 1 isoform X2 [Cryptomeria japonica]
MHSAVIIPNFASRSNVYTRGHGGQNYRIPVIWKKDSHGFVKWVPSFTDFLSTRKKPNCRVRRVENEKVNPIQGKRKEADGVSSNHCSDNIDKEALNISTSFDWEWLPAFPHVLMASVSNVLFGYHIGAEANSLNEMILGRFLVGLGIGANTVLVPIYISEVSPTKYRGSLGTISQLGTCVGLIVALALGVPCESDSHWWRAMFRIASVIGCLLIIGMQFVAESPRWLGKVGRWEEAKIVISQLWGSSQVESAIKELKDANNLDRSYEESNWSDLLTKRHYKAPAIGGTLFFLQQFAGINGVLYFSSLTFADVGISNNTVASIALGIANFAGAIIALYLMDKQGRRNLLMGSYIGMASSMFLLIIPFGVPLNEQTSHFLSIFGTLMYVFTFAIGAGPITGLIIPELSSTRTRAKTMAFSLCVHWVFNFVVGLLFLDTVEKFGLTAVYSSFGIVSLLAVAFTYYYVSETKGRSLEEIEFLLNPELERRD